MHCSGSSRPKKGCSKESTERTPRPLGFPNAMIESFAKTFRTTSYAHKGLAAKTMVTVSMSRDPLVLGKWNEMWNEMQTNQLHPRELFEFYKKLTGRNKIE